MVGTPRALASRRRCRGLRGRGTFRMRAIGESVEEEEEEKEKEEGPGGREDLIFFFDYVFCVSNNIHTTPSILLLLAGLIRGEDGLSLRD